MAALRMWCRAVVLALLFVAARSSSGRASVKCLSSGTPSNGIPQVLVVFPKFSAPKRGQCSEPAGYEASTPRAYPASATACLNAAGSKIYIGLTIRAFEHSPGGPGTFSFEKLIGFELPYPASIGGLVSAETSGALDATSVSDASLTTCHPSPMP